MKKLVVVAQNDDIIQCIGVFDSGREAYGKAFLYLCNLIDDYEVGGMKGLSISNAILLEADTGFRMRILGDSKITDFVDILFCEEEKDDE